LSKIDTLNSKYVFIIDTKGLVLLNASKPELVGKNIFDTDDNISKKIIGKMFTTLADKDEAFISYSRINPEKNRYEVKYTYIARIKNTDWIIGSGFYQSDINKLIEKKQYEMIKVEELKYSKLFIISSILILISLIASYFISKYD